MVISILETTTHIKIKNNGLMCMYKHTTLPSNCSSFVQVGGCFPFVLK